MKAQFATIESLMALSIALSALAVTGRIAYSYQQSFDAARLSAESSAAAYDLIMQLSSNSTAESCLRASYNGSQCLGRYYALYRSAYGIGAIGVISGNINSAYANSYCAEGGGGIICVGVS